MNINKQMKVNEKGQALVFVIVTMTIALSIGVGVSLRNLASISRTSTSDTASRVRAAAEGGAENVLARSDTELRSNALSGTPIVVTFTPVNSSEDKITALAEVTVSLHGVTSFPDYYTTTIEDGQVSEINLEGYSSGDIDICWRSTDSDKGSDLYYIAYNDSGDLEKGGAQAIDRTGFPADYSSSLDSPSSGRDSFDDCFNTTLPSSPMGIRIRSINADSETGIYPTGGASLPTQGYLISSVGRLTNVEAEVEASNSVGTDAVVEVFRSLPYLPGIFDFGIFSSSGIIN